MSEKAYQNAPHQVIGKKTKNLRKKRKKEGRIVGVGYKEKAEKPSFARTKIREIPLIHFITNLIEYLLFNDIFILVYD